MQALVGGTLIDGRGGEPLEDSTVLVGDDGRIAATGPREAVAMPEGTDVLDISGLTIMPGLIDCHEHLASFTYDLISRWGLAEPQSTRTLRIANVIEDTLQSGLHHHTRLRLAGGGIQGSGGRGPDNGTATAGGGRASGAHPQRAGPAHHVGPPPL